MLRKEATYVFNFEGREYRSDVFVDPVENRRYPMDSIYNGNKLDYTGTGTAYQEIQAELVFQSEPYEEPSMMATVVELMYKLPDVNQYAVGLVSVAPSEDLYFYSVIFLPKI